MRALTAEGFLAPKHSPVLTGIPYAPTAAADDNSAQIATTAFVDGQAGTTTPAADGTGAAGTSLRYAREDHVHPGSSAATPLHYGVLASADAALSATSVASGTGILTFSLAAASPLWINNASGILTPVTLAAVSGGTLTPGALPASGQYRGYGIEIDSAGALTLSTGGTDQTTAALALANINTIPAAGKMRLHDIILLNTAGAYTLNTSRDRRAWANGAKAYISATGRTAASGATPVAITGLTPVRLELPAAGATILRARVQISGTNSGGSGVRLLLLPVMDALDFAGASPSAAAAYASTIYPTVNTPLVTQVVARVHHRDGG